MSAGITDSDSMFSVRKTPWHGLGAVLEEPPATVAEAIEAAGALRGSALPLTAAMSQNGDWSLPPVRGDPGYYATVRQDTREVLGIVGERYRIVQRQ
jgi:hypothetical protein